MRLVLQFLKEHQIYPKFSKCEFWLRSVSFLDDVISGKGVKVDPNQTDAFRNWPRPLNPTDIRSLLSLAGYYRSSVDGVSSVASPLITLTQKKVKFE